MAVQEIQVVILNHREKAIAKFGSNSSALEHYQSGEHGKLVDALRQQWFSVTEGCIVAHHLATVQDNDEVVNTLVVVNAHRAIAQQELLKQKGNLLRYLFILFESDESKAREMVYQIVRPTLAQHHPVHVDVSYHNVSFM